MIPHGFLALGQVLTQRLSHHRQQVRHGLALSWHRVLLPKGLDPVSHLFDTVLVSQGPD